MTIADARADAQSRIDELVAWIDHALTLPMYAYPTEASMEEAAADLKSWRRLLLNGLHPSAPTDPVPSIRRARSVATRTCVCGDVFDATLYGQAEFARHALFAMPHGAALGDVLGGAYGKGEEK